MNNADIRAERQAAAAVEKAQRMKAERSYACNVVYADVIVDGERVGHIASDGYTHDTWTFYPHDDGRRELRNKMFAYVLPKWVTNRDWKLERWENSAEKSDQTAEKMKKERREEMLASPIYKALESEAFPCNPIPFADAIAEHVREFGTDSVKSDEVKRILWVLMGQAYGQLAVINLCDEWDRLCKS